MPTNIHRTYMPRRPEVSEQCVSCPFRKGNDADFGVIVDLLRKRNGMVGPTSKLDVAFARYAVMDQVAKTPEFACHWTVYDEKMNLRPDCVHRQCKGATQFYVSQGEKTCTGTNAGS